MKRKATSDIRSHGLPKKRAKLDEECLSAIDLPEIFAHVLSYLINKPKDVINLARISTKCYANLRNVSVWRQLDFKPLMANNGQLAHNVLAVMLQKMEYDRLRDKLLKTHVQISKFDARRDRMTPSHDPAQLSEEARQFTPIRRYLNKRYKPTGYLPIPFYEHVLTNRLLNDSILQAIAATLSTSAEYEFLPVLFRAFEFVLGSSKADLEREAEREVPIEVPRLYIDDNRWGTVFPTLTKVQPDKPNITAKQAELYSSSFIVFSSNPDYEDRDDGRYSYFFKYCCGDTKAVIFVMQDSFDSEITINDYYKVNLVTKSIESSGSFENLINAKKYHRGPGRYARLTRAVIDLFEMSVSEEELWHLHVDDWLQSCKTDGFLIDWLEDDNFEELDAELESFDDSEFEDWA